MHNICYITSGMPKQVDHAERRRAIADAAVDVIAGGGLDTAGLREVARRAEVTTGALTHYFASKDALLAAAYETVMTGLALRQAATPPAGDPAAFAETLADFLPLDARSAREWRVWLAFSARAVADPELAARHRAHYATIVARLAAQRPGPDAAAFADALVALVDGVALRVLLEPDEWPRARAVATFAVLLAPLFTETAR